MRVHAFLALLAGFAVMFAIMLASTALVRKFLPPSTGSHSTSRQAEALVNLLSSFIAAMAGGYIAGWVADNNALRVVLGLAIVVLVVGAISALQVLVPGGKERGKQPVWYQIMLVVITPLGVVAGGLLRLRAAGAL